MRIPLQVICHWCEEKFDRAPDLYHHVMDEHDVTPNGAYATVGRAIAAAIEVAVKRAKTGAVITQTLKHQGITSTVRNRRPAA